MILSRGPLIREAMLLFLCALSVAACDPAEPVSLAPGADPDASGAVSVAADGVLPTPLPPPMGAGPLAPGLPPDQQAGLSHAPPLENRMEAALRAGQAGDGNQATAEAAARERASAGSDDLFTELTWEELYELDLETGRPSPLLAGLDGQPVKIAGFMVPLDDAATAVREFLLVPYAGACIHVPPPPANQIVHVVMVDGFEAEVRWWDPIWARGVLNIDDVEHAFGSASYRMEGLHVDVHTFDGGMP